MLAAKPSLRRHWLGKRCPGAKVPEMQARSGFACRHRRDMSPVEEAVALPEDRQGRQPLTQLPMPQEEIRIGGPAGACLIHGEGLIKKKGAGGQGPKEGRKERTVKVVNDD